MLIAVLLIVLTIILWCLGRTGRVLLGVMLLLFVIFVCTYTPTPELPQDQRLESLSP